MALRWVCPMCPSVDEVQAGPCPHCGMALEPTEPVDDDGELHSMTRRLAAAVVLSVPVVALAMGGMVLHAPSGSVWVEALCCTGVVWGAGWPLVARGARSFVSGHLNMFSLIGMGVVVSYVYSVAAVLLPQSFPSGFRAADGQVAVYFEAASVMVTFALIGQVLELRARQRTGNALRALLALESKSTTRVDADGVDTVVPLSDVGVGDTLRVRPGENVPVDGVIVEGRPSINEAMMTGESASVEKREHDAVVGGTLNGSVAFVMRASAVGKDTVLARIVSLVSEARRGRAPIQAVADRVASWFVPVVLGVATLTFVVWALLPGEAPLASAMVRSVAVLIVACPCALGLATPMAMTVAMGRGAKEGVLFRDPSSIQRMARIDTWLLDKTGTLTEGRPRVVDVWTEGDEERLFACAAALERASEHPLARAVVEAARERGVRALAADDVEAVPGGGIVGNVEGRETAVGGVRWLLARGMQGSAWVTQADAWAAQGWSTVWVVEEGHLVGGFAMADPIRRAAAASIHALQALGHEVVLLSGDRREVAEQVARALNIETVIADVDPVEKKAVVDARRNAGARVAMVGDGINDAPALAAADVGVAMGSGTDVAMQSSDVTLLSGDVGALLRASCLSQETMRNVRQNLVFAFGYNAICIPLAAGVLATTIGVSMSPMVAAAAMSLSSVSVIANALRLGRADAPPIGRSPERSPEHPSHHQCCQSPT